MTIRIDATMINDFVDCRELFRRRHVERLDSVKPQIHRVFGSAIHQGIELFWRGSSYQEAMTVASKTCLALDQSLLSMKERERWDEMTRMVPECLAAYYAHFPQWEQGFAEAHGVTAIEREWDTEIEGLQPDWMPSGYSLCGKIDRVMNGCLIEVKTASEIGKEWKRAYRDGLVRNYGLQLYGWYLCRGGNPPRMVQAEVIVKPYRGSLPRIEIFELPEIIAARKRFEQQLKWLVLDIAHHLDNYREAKSWPMSGGNMCKTIYGECPMLELCNRGDNPRSLAQFKPKEEHLQIRK